MSSSYEMCCDVLFKLVLLGDLNVGKTSLAKRLRNEEFDGHSSPTIWNEVSSWMFKAAGQHIFATIWDTCGQERFSALTKEFYRGAHGALLVFDVTDSHSFDRLERWLRGFRDVCEADAPVLLIGNKVDKTLRQVTRDQAESFASANHLSYFETSAKTRENVETVFTALIEASYRNVMAAQELAFQTGSSIHASTLSIRLKSDVSKKPSNTSCFC